MKYPALIIGITFIIALCTMALVRKNEDLEKAAKKIRDDKGYWNQIESYIQKHSVAEFSHGICQECAKKYYPGFNLCKD